VPFYSCRHAGVRSDKLADTIEKLRKLADFRPLVENEAYSFLNNYYLPRLDTLKTRRKLYIHPINTDDFIGIFNRDKLALEKEYEGNRQPGTLTNKPLLPPSIIFEKNYSWDKKRLYNTQIIPDTSEQPKTFEAWRKKYGYGYSCISYPVYNINSKILIIREWIEDDSFCGTGRERRFVFTKTPNGWTTR